MIVAAVFLAQHASPDSDQSDNDPSGVGETKGSARSEKDQSSTQIADEWLAQWVKIESSYQRASVLFEWLADADTNELIGMLRNSESIGRNSRRTALQSAAIRKLAILNTDQALSWILDVPKVRRAPLLRSAFHEWSLTDLDHATEKAQSLRGIDRRVALESMLSSRNDLAPSEILEIARELGLEEVGLQSISEAQTLELLNDPASAWDVLVNDGLDDSKQLELLKLVVSAWQEREGFDVLLQVANSFPSKDDRTALSTVIAGVLESDIENAFAWLRNVPRTLRGELPCALAMALARTDPIRALEQVESWSDEPIHVQLEHSVANTWAHTDPRTVLDAIETVPQSARWDAMNIALIRLVSESPLEAMEYLEATKSFVRNDGRLRWRMVAQWAHIDPEAALEWVIEYSDQDTELLRSLRQGIFRKLVRVDAERALDIARETTWSTLISVRDATEYDVVWGLAEMGRIEDAIALLPQIHEQARYFAIDDLGERLVRAGDPYAAVELGIDIPSLDAPLIGPVSYFHWIFDLWATRDPQQLFQALESITSPVIRSMAAKKLIDLQEATPALTEDQIETAQALLSERPITGSILRQELELREEKGLIDLDELVVPEEWLE